MRVWDLRVATAGGVAKLDVKGRPVASFDPQARHEWGPRLRQGLSSASSAQIDLALVFTLIKF